MSQYLLLASSGIQGMIPFVAGGALAVCAVIVVFLLFTSAQERLANKDSFKVIETYAWRGDDLVAKEIPFSERVLIPLSGRLSGFSSRLTFSGYIDKTRYRLAMTGRRGPDELNKFLTRRVLWWVGGFLMAMVFALLPFPNAIAAYKPLAVIAMLAAGFYGADAKLNEELKKRQKSIRKNLPDILDLLTISVEAGLGFEQAIDRITTAIPGPLSDEFNRMMGEMRAGSSRADALVAMEQRIGLEEVKSFVLSMVQADQFGVSIGRVLRAQADEMRIKRRQLAQEAAQKAPVKMLLPMVFLIFPALFIVVLGPALYNIAKNFAS